LARIDKHTSERIPPEQEVHPAIVMPPAAESDLPSAIPTAVAETSQLAETANLNKRARIEVVFPISSPIAFNRGPLLLAMELHLSQVPGCNK
jgi:hypothetical protein